MDGKPFIIPDSVGAYFLRAATYISEEENIDLYLFGDVEEYLDPEN